MRVGIVTGSVAVTLGAVNEGMVAGDAVNTAARVQTAAEPGTVWVDQETRGLTAAAVAYSDMGEHAMKGKAEPARLFRADDIVAAIGGAQRVDGLEAPMTGRDVEVRRVKELFHATQSDGRPRVVAGERAARVWARAGWAGSSRSTSTACPTSCGGTAAGACRTATASRSGPSPRWSAPGSGCWRARTRSRCGPAWRRAAPSWLRTTSEAAWLTSRVEALLGVWEGPAFDRTDLFAAWTTLLDRVGQTDVNGVSLAPVVLLFEDAQYADSGLLDLVEHLLESARAPVFALVLTRPELLEQRPSLVAGRRATVIELAPLGDAAMGTLVDGLVADLPDRARSAIAARAEGVPLYAVETVRSLIDRDVVVARDGRYVFVDHDHQLVDLDQLAAPTSLQTLIASRLDALTPLERRTVQDASVLGMTFRHDGLMALNDVGSYELDLALAGLVRKGLVETKHDPRSPERGQYGFLQALVREVAHSTLARKDRRARHLAAADHLESEGGDTIEALAGVIAQHLLDALDATSAHDAARVPLAARTRRVLVATAARAESLGSPHEALQATRNALALEPGAEETLDLQARGARVAVAGGDYERGLDLGAAAFAGYQRADRATDAAAVCYDLNFAALGLGRGSEAAQFARTGLELVAAEDHRLRINLLRALLGAVRFAPDQSERTERTLEMVRLAEELGSPADLVTALNNLAIMLVDAGSPTAYVAVLERCITLSRQHRLMQPLSRSLCNLAAELYPNELARSIELVEESIVTSKQVGESYMLETALGNAGFSWWLAGDFDRVGGEFDDYLDGRASTAAEGWLLCAEAAVRRARGERLRVRDELPDSEDPWEQHGTDLYLALRREDDGDLVAAAAVAAEVTHRTYGDGDMMEDFEVGWAPAVDLQLRAGDLDAAERLLPLAGPVLGGRARALTLAEHARLRGTIAARRGHDAEADLAEAVERHDVYGAPYLAAVSRLELGRWLLAQGRGAEAVPLLEAARATFLRLGAAATLTELDAVAPSEVLTS